MEHPIGEMMHSTMNSIKDMVDVKHGSGRSGGGGYGCDDHSGKPRLLRLRDGRRRSAGQREEQNASADGAGNVSPLQAEAAQEYRCSR